jgi:hypothetical protein
MEGRWISRQSFSSTAATATTSGSFDTACWGSEVCKPKVYTSIHETTFSKSSWQLLRTGLRGCMEVSWISRQSCSSTATQSTVQSTVSW